MTAAEAFPRMTRQPLRGSPFLYMTRPPLGALPYCRFWQVVKPHGMAEPHSVDNWQRRQSHVSEEMR